MRRSCVAALLTILVLWVSGANAQFKSQVTEEPRVVEGLMRSEALSPFFGWFNPEKFHMRHSLSFSYVTAGGHALSLGTYTNSMTYEFAENLNARADVSLSYSPYNSFSTFGKKNDFSSVYLSRAQLNYRPWENMMVEVQYRTIPYGYSYYSPYGDPWYRERGF